MILEIVQFGHDALRKKGAPICEITPEIQTLAQNMIETMHAAQGVGLAAQQVGVPIQLAVLDVTGADDRPSTMLIRGRPADIAAYMPMALINPVLELGPGSESGIEGCLSFPDIQASIARAPEVLVTATLLDGSPIEFTAAGLLSRALQHEVDHLHGILFIDRMNSATRAGLAGKLKRMHKQNAGR